MKDEQLEKLIKALTYYTPAGSSLDDVVSKLDEINNNIKQTNKLLEKLGEK